MKKKKKIFLEDNLGWREIMEEYLQELGVNKQGPTLKHSELCSMSCGSLERRGVWGRMDTCICMAELLRCLPKTITTLLISYIPIQN